MIKTIVFVVAIAMLAMGGTSQSKMRTDMIKTEAGDLEIGLLGHGSLMFKYQGKVVYIDPFSKVADYSKLPKADVILVTHDHPDHLDPTAIKQIKTDKTILVSPKAALDKVKGAASMQNGESKSVGGFPVEAVPAYNIVHKRGSGQPYHPKGWGNGYIITFGNLKVYVAGDTENVPEMKSLKGIDIAFLPINTPYTMTAEMVADAAKSFKPRILYPYHHAMGTTDVSKLPALMKDVAGVELRMTNDKRK